LKTKFVDSTVTIAQMLEARKQ